MAMPDKEENAFWERMWSARHARAPPKWLHFMSPQLEWSHFSQPPCTALLIRSLLLLWHLAFGSWCFVLGYCFWAKVHGVASSFSDANLNNQFPKMLKMMAPKITSRHTAQDTAVKSYYRLWSRMTATANHTTIKKSASVSSRLWLRAQYCFPLAPELTGTPNFLRYWPTWLGSDVQKNKMSTIELFASKILAK